MGKVDKESLLTQTRLKEVLEYNFETGELVWIERRAGRTFGKSAGGVDKGHGYIQIRINDRLYLAHRLIWLYVHGKFPSGEKNQLDHIDGNKTNNRLENLRECSRTENARNQKMKSNNTSGFTGVCLENTNERFSYWTATWTDVFGILQRKRFSVRKLGSEKAKELAISFRNEKMQELASHGIVYSERHGT